MTVSFAVTRNGALAGRASAACVAIVLLTCQTGAQELKVAPVPLPPPAGELAAPEPLYAAPTRADRAGRIHASVTINGAGPYRFMLDTGANTSALAPHVAEELRLQGAGDTQIEVHGVTGSALLQAVRVESLRAGDVQLPPMNLPVLPGPVFGGADGILGINGLQATRIEIDFERDSVVIVPSTGRRAAQGMLVVPARLRKGGLLLVKGKVGKVPVQVIVDTGAEHTLGNLALRTALLERARYDDEVDVTVLGATTAMSAGTHFRAPRITIGEADLMDLPVTFGDLHVFEIWALTETPALVIGMDILGTLRQFVVDYKRREFQLKPHDRPGILLDHCVGRRCASRIPAGP